MFFFQKFNITNKITTAIAIVERARGFLDAANLSASWIKKMQSRALILEAYHSTHIEGTHLTLNQSEKLWEGSRIPNVDSNDVRELLNYRNAFDLVANYLKNKEPITEALIREIHKKLVEGVRGNSAGPGAYRKIQNYVANSKTKKVIYTPPAAYQVPLMMKELIEWIRNEKEINSILIAGIAQFQLVHIHPFLDGNGRTARLFSTLCLYKSGYDFKRLFTISEYYDRDRFNYYKAIQSVRENDMDLTIWLEYFVTGLATQIKEIQNSAKKIMKVEVLSLKYNLSAREKTALKYALEKNRLSIKEFEHLCPNASKRTLQRELKHLVEIGLLKVKGKTNIRVYFSNL